jgi:hypothetical protein
LYCLLEWIDVEFTLTTLSIRTTFLSAAWPNNRSGSVLACAQATRYVRSTTNNASERTIKHIGFIGCCACANRYNKKTLRCAKRCKRISLHHRSTLSDDMLQSLRRRRINSTTCWINICERMSESYKHMQVNNSRTNTRHNAESKHNKQN